jgi:hypothetical protein
MNAGPRKKPNHLVWIGPLVSIIGLVSYFTFFARFPALRDVPKINMPLVAAGLVMSLWALFRRRSLWAVAGLLVSVICAGLLATYVYVLSNQLPHVDRVVQVGEVAPVFALADHTGQVIDLANYRESNVALVFYRGFW